MLGVFDFVPSCFFGGLCPERDNNSKPSALRFGNSEGRLA
jgi:hypothetical protein